LSALEDISRVMRQPNPDPETEQVRQEMWRRYRQMLAWIFGFPVANAGLYAAVIIIPHAHS
jgi:hypothetical protein